MAALVISHSSTATGSPKIAALDWNAPLSYTGELPVTNGGTGAANVSDARTNLGVLAKAGDTATGALTAPAFLCNDPAGTSGGGLGFSSYATAGSTQYNVIWAANNGFPISMYALHDPGVNARVTLRFNGTDDFAFFNGGQAAKTGGGSWTSICDARAKDGIEDWDAGLDVILALRVRQWRYKAQTGIDPTITYRGLVAQEAEEVAPTMVRKRKGAIGTLEFDDLRDVDPSDLPYILVNAVKSLSARLVAAEAEIKALKAR